MYTELVFSAGSPDRGDGYVGGGACLPSYCQWPAAADGETLVHLFSVPAHWFWSEAESGYRVSVFIPYAPRQVTHYRRLRAKEGRSEAVVLAYESTQTEREESGGKALERGRMVRETGNQADDDQNLASKLDGIDAWLQSKIEVDGFRRRLSIYGGDFDLATPSTTGMLSDGMGYLLLSDKQLEPASGGDIGRFFLQLG